MEENAAIEVLRQVKTILDAYRIDYWLDIGTLLGAVRDNKIISWDHDIDLGTWQNNTSKVCQAFKQFRDDGFRVRYNRYILRLEKQGCPLSIILYKLENGSAKIHWGPNCISHWNHKFVSILLWAAISTHYANVSLDKAPSIREVALLVLCRFARIIPLCLKEWAKKIEHTRGSRFVWIVPADYFFNLSTMKFYGMEIKVPAKTEEYLTYRYGKNWRIPRKDWVTARDDGAVFCARECFKEVLCSKT